MWRSVPTGLFFCVASALTMAFSGCSGPRTPDQGAATPGRASSVGQADARSESVRFGAGWGPLETYNSETFRWARNDAQLVVCPDSVHHVVKVALEPGPSLGAKAMTLLVRSSPDGSDKRVLVTDRRPIGIDVKPTRTMDVLTLHVASKNLPVPKEKRVLNFRAFSADLDGAGNCGEDVIPASASLKVGKGWYPLEKFHGETFRWIKNDAEIAVLNPSSNLLIELEVAPGPGLGNEPLRIQLTDRTGKVVAVSDAVTQRAFIALRAGPVAAGDSLTLRVRSQGKIVGGDARTLNFRVFEAYPVQAGRG